MSTEELTWEDEDDEVPTKRSGRPLVDLDKETITVAIVHPSDGTLAGVHCTIYLDGEQIVHVGFEADWRRIVRESGIGLDPYHERTEQWLWEEAERVYRERHAARGST